MGQRLIVSDNREDPGNPLILDGQAIEEAARDPVAIGKLMVDQAWAEGRVVESYAFARVGYHRGLDALRRNGWKGHGPVPWSHEPNRGFLRCLIALQRAADAINEADEAERCAAFISDCDPTLA